MKLCKVIGIGSVGLLMGFMPMQVQQTPSELPPTTALSTAVIPADPPSEAVACVPMEYGQRKTWTCDGRHQLTFSEPQAWCREVGRQTICERE